MNKNFYFFFVCAVSIIISNFSLATEKYVEKSPENPKKKARLVEPDDNTYPSLKEYLQNKENTLNHEEDISEQARIATQLTLEDEGILPVEDQDNHEE